MKIEKIINLNSKKFENWSQQMLLQNRKSTNYNDLKDIERDKIFYSTNEMLFEIAQCFFRYGNFRDEWDTSRCQLNVDGQNLILRSKKMNQEFLWGLGYNKFYIECHLYNVKNLRYMTDDFWEKILELNNYGEIKFNENLALNSNQKKQFGNNTSNVFRLIRNYILFLDEKLNYNACKNDLEMDLGWFEIQLDSGSSWKNLLENSCKAFKNLYQINYQLWKITK